MDNHPYLNHGKANKKCYNMYGNTMYNNGGRAILRGK